jgi:membrane protease YdiL (CAAX protease family)
LALAGIVLITKGGSAKPLESWDEVLQRIRQVSIGYILWTVLGFMVYTYLVFHLLSPEALHTKAQGVYQLLATILLVFLTAIHEEMIFRLFMIGLFVYLLRRVKFRWAIGIAISSAMWSYSHWFVGDLGLIKFIQVLPFGVSLGYTLRRYGFEACVLIHILSNLVNLVWMQAS